MAGFDFSWCRVKRAAEEIQVQVYRFLQDSNFLSEVLFKNTPCAALVWFSPVGRSEFKHSP